MHMIHTTSGSLPVPDDSSCGGEGRSSMVTCSVAGAADTADAVPSKGCGISQSALAMDDGVANCGV